jgi:hypothetical protein
MLKFHQEFSQTRWGKVFQLVPTFVLIVGFLAGSIPFAALSQQEISAAIQNNLSPADADGKFSIAVYPDTQMEVFEKIPAHHDAVPATRFRNRSQWLIDNKDKLDLRFVLHTGDMVNWEDDREQSQYQVASNGFEPLDGVIPYATALGNHDTHAVGPSGGSARDTAHTKTYVRNTTVFNTFFPLSRFPDAITYEPGKIDNAYQTFKACGKKWLILTLELWPRKGAIDWAEEVIASHPDYNVIIGTHSYLNANGEIFQGSDYGERSPQYLFDNLVRKYANIKMVFCGHTGRINDRTDTGIHGNKIVSTVACIHEQKTNPVQIMKIDVNSGTLHRKFFSPFDDFATGYEWQDYGKTIADMDFVKPVSEKPALSDAIKRASALEETKYSPASRTALKAALTSAKTVLDNPQSTDSEYLAAIDAITTAKNHLVTE